MVKFFLYKIRMEKGTTFLRPVASSLKKITFFMAFGVNDTGSHTTADGGYAGAAPVKTASNAATGRVYVAIYFDKWAGFDGNAGAPETRLAWVG